MWTLKDGELVWVIGPYTMKVIQLDNLEYRGIVTDGRDTHRTLFDYQTLPYCQAATIRVARAMALAIYTSLSEVSEKWHDNLPT